MATLYSPKIVTNDLILTVDPGNTKSYPGSGTSIYNLADSQSGTISNNPTFTSSNNGYFQFDGTDDQILISGLPSETISEGSFFFWSTSNNTTASSSPFGWHRNQWSLRSHQSYLYLGWGGTETSVSFSSTGTNWRYLGVTISSGTGTFYKNGEVINTRTGYPTTTTSPSSIYLGRRNHGSGYWYNGNISIAQVYHRALTAQEVLQNYNATKGRYGL